MSFQCRFTIGFLGLLVRILERLADVIENIADGGVASARNARDRVHRLEPGGRQWRRIGCRLVVFFDFVDRVRDLAMQRRVSAQVACHNRVDAVKLALNCAFASFLSK